MISVPAVMVVLLRGKSGLMETMNTPSAVIMCSASGWKTKSTRIPIISAVIRLDTGPAERIANWASVFFFANYFSSDSTNAARSGPKKANPVDLLGMLWNRA